MIKTQLFGMGTLGGVASSRTPLPYQGLWITEFP